MAVTYQVWEWTNMATNSPERTVNDIPAAITANQEYDLFTGTVGNQTTIPPQVRANQFVVIKEMGVTPTNQSFIQVRINTTDYFQNPDLSAMKGLSANAIPYPCGASSYGNGQGGDGSSVTIPSFKLEPALYILPGQTWTMLYSSEQGITGGAGNEGGTVGVMIYYVLYDGADALVANKLLEMGIPVTESNVDWWKQQALAANLSNLTMTGGAR